MTSADAIVVGAGLAGLVAAAELADRGRRVIVVEQEPASSLGGQAFWSFGGLFLVDSPEQRRLGIRDSRELAWGDWLGSAGFDRVEDAWPRRWAEAYVDFAAGEKRAWLHAMGLRFFPVVGWAERGGALATGHGNSVPRFHVTWGTGPGVLAPFLRRVRDAQRRGLISFHFRHRVNAITRTQRAVDGVAGEQLEASDAARGVASTRAVVGDFAFRAPIVIVAAGGIGGNHELVRASWPSRLGTAPRRMLSGVPAHVDGRMLGIAEEAGRASSIATACGTTRKASRTGRRSGSGMGSGSSRDPRPSGSTRAAAGSRRRSFPGSTRWRPWSIWPEVGTTTAGSC